MGVGGHARGVVRAGLTRCPEVPLPCHPLLSRSLRGFVALALVPAGCALAGRAPGLSPYRPPAVVLAYPARGVALSADKPVVVFRFAPREAGDPVDAASFRATVDGVDRTDWFRVTAVEALGTVADPAAETAATGGAAAGPHTVMARVCSARGVCGGLSVVVVVRPWDQAPTAPRPTFGTSRGSA